MEIRPTCALQTSYGEIQWVVGSQFPFYKGKFVTCLVSKELLLHDPFTWDDKEILDHYRETNHSLCCILSVGNLCCHQTFGLSVCIIYVYSKICNSFQIKWESNLSNAIHWKMFVCILLFLSVSAVIYKKARASKSLTWCNFHINPILSVGNLPTQTSHSQSWVFCIQPHLVQESPQAWCWVGPTPQTHTDCETKNQRWNSWVVLCCLFISTNLVKYH